MKLAVVVLCFFLSSAGLSAQAVLASGQESFGIAGGQLKVDSAVLPATPWSNVSGCPVSLRATQISSASMKEVRKGQPQQSGQRLHLTLTSRDSKQITSATVVVRGFGSTPGVSNALATSARRGNGPSSETRTIEIAFAAQTAATVGTDILVRGVSASQTIDLVRLIYADGTSWKLAEGQACRITPDPLMLIGAVSR